MKRFLIIGILAIWITACSKNVQTASVPESVVTAFNQRYPTAEEVDWEVNADDQYEAEFWIGDQKKEAVYRSNGDLVKAVDM